MCSQCSVTDDPLSTYFLTTKRTSTSDCPSKNREKEGKMYSTLLLWKRHGQKWTHSFLKNLNVICICSARIELKIHIQFVKRSDEKNPTPFEFGIMRWRKRRICCTLQRMNEWWRYKKYFTLFSWTLNYQCSESSKATACQQKYIEKPKRNLPFNAFFAFSCNENVPTHIQSATQSWEYECDSKIENTRRKKTQEALFSSRHEPYQSHHSDAG